MFWSFSSEVDRWFGGVRKNAARKFQTNFVNNLVEGVGAKFV
jgi:hypothetical protein